MARELVAIKVKIGLKPNGHADYPNFNILQSVIDSGMDWSKYIDVFGTGWHYDTKFGHVDDDVSSPIGFQWGVLLVPKIFAQQALAAFPTVITELSESQLETFYDNNIAYRLPSEQFDNDILAGIKIKQDMGIALTQDQTDALDPTKPNPGIVTNPDKTWATFKAKKALTILKTLA